MACRGYDPMAETRPNSPLVQLLAMDSTGRFLWKHPWQKGSHKSILTSTVKPNHHSATNLGTKSSSALWGCDVGGSCHASPPSPHEAIRHEATVLNATPTTYTCRVNWTKFKTKNTTLCQIQCLHRITPNTKHKGGRHHFCSQNAQQLGKLRHAFLRLARVVGHQGYPLGRDFHLLVILGVRVSLQELMVFQGLGQYRPTVLPLWLCQVKLDSARWT